MYDQVKLTEQCFKVVKINKSCCYIVSNVKYNKTMEENVRVQCPRHLTHILLDRKTGQHHTNIICSLVQQNIF